MTSDRASVGPSDASGAETSDAPGEKTSDGSACTFWDNGDCEGTPRCPPRCPRFFDDAGTAFLARPPRDDEWDLLETMYDELEASAMGLPPATPERRAQWLDRLRETGWNLLARSDDRVVGHVGVVAAADAAPELVVFVRDEFHDRGIGTELVRQAVAHGADRDHDALTLIAEPGNRRAVAVYTNVGFEVVDRDLELRMRLPLDDPAAETAQLPPAERLSDQ